MAKPQLTIIIPKKNTKAYHRDTSRLEDVLESLKRQTDQRFEVIVSDVDSDPYYRRKHKMICEKYKARHIYTKTGGCWNINRARNIGIRKARTPYVMTTDVDCVFAPDFVKTVLEIASPEKILHCRVSDLPKSYRGRIDDFAEMKHVSTLRPPYCYGGCQVVAKTWAVKVHGFDEEYILWGADDEDFYERAIQDGLKNVWIEDKTSFYHQWHSQDNREENPEQLSVNRMRLRMTKKGRLPVIRNPFGWGKCEERGDIDDIAVLVTTFMRDDQLYDCVRSIRLYYPSIAIYVADNSKDVSPKKKRFCSDHSCTLVKTPFDSGVGRSRNACMKKIPKKYHYVVICEDDIRFTPQTRLETWRNILHRKKLTGIVGGLLNVKTHVGRREQRYEGNISIKENILYLQKIERPDWEQIENVRLFYCDMILNVFMMRRIIWDEVKWDIDMKTAPEHDDFFLQVKLHTNWKVAYTPQVALDHYKEEANSRDYNDKRNRLEGFEHFAKKWGLDYIWSSWHTQYGLDNPLRIKGITSPKKTIQEKPKTRNSKLAICIKTFMREQTFFKALDSIGENVKMSYCLYIADDGEVSDEKEYRYQQLERRGHKVFRLPFNVGLSSGRNKIVKATEEDYVLIMDDDIAIRDGSILNKMKGILDHDDQIGIVAGVLHQEMSGDPFGSVRYSQGLDLRIQNGILYRDGSPRELHKGNGSLFHYTEQTVNFFMAKREVFNDILWDDRIKIEYEHMDFFLRLKDTDWKVAICSEAKAVHLHSPLVNYEYNRYRRAITSHYFMQKHNIQRVVNRF